MRDLIEDVELSFKLLEFSIRTMCYAELDKIDTDVFGQEIQLQLHEENVVYSDDKFKNINEIVNVAQMAVGAAFGSTAICLDCVLEAIDSKNSQMTIIRSLVSAVRNAFSHGIAAPRWYVKPHKREILDLSFIDGPQVNLASLNDQLFDYSKIGGLAAWYRVKEYVIRNT